MNIAVTLLIEEVPRRPGDSFCLAAVIVAIVSDASSKLREFRRWPDAMLMEPSGVKVDTGPCKIHGPVCPYIALGRTTAFHAEPSFTFIPVGASRLPLWTIPSTRTVFSVWTARPGAGRITV